MSNSDFEVLPVGSATELRLSRALSQAIEQMQRQYPGTVPAPVMKAYSELRNHCQVMAAAEAGG